MSKSVKSLRLRYGRKTFSNPTALVNSLMEEINHFILETDEINQNEDDYTITTMRRVLGHLNDLPEGDVVGAL